MSTLEDLPPETLRHICEYVPPQGLTFSSKGIGGSWDLYVQEENGPRIKVVRNLTHANTINNPQCKHCFGQKPCGCQYTILDEIHTALLHVNKRIAAEARAVFFRGNVFRLTIDSIAYQPVSLESSLIFGPLGLPHRLHLLRDLRQIELDLVLDEDYMLWGWRRQQARIQHFVDIIRQYAENENKKLLLQRLHVRITLQLGVYRQSTDSWNWERVINRAWALEPLVSTPGIEEITFSLSHSAGEPSWRWFGQCLILRMRGEGGELKEVDRSVRVSKRWENTGATRTSERLKDVDAKKKEKVVITEKKTDDPTFD